VIQVEQSAVDFLSNQPVEGELLADVLARGRLSGEDALRYAVEIGTILNRAHTRGLVHGCLSPYTIAITGAGARVLRPALTSDGRSAPYCSPEQVRGEMPDVRSDIFSYGAVLYEMASGKRAFAGTGGDLYHQILEEPPPLFNGKTKFHIAMEGVIAGCLAKDPAARRQRIQNAVIELKLASPKTKAIAAVPPSKPAAAPGFEKLPDRPQDGSPWPPRALQYRPASRISLRQGLGLVAASMIAIAAMAGFALAFLRPWPAAPVVSFRVASPENASQPGPPSISPDGRLLALPAVGPDGRRMLWLRPLDDLRMTPLAGTEGASAPFWSPDSKYIGFFANQLLKKVPSAGGPVDTICPAESMAGGGAWNSDDTILFAPGMMGGLYRVSAKGGTPEAPLKTPQALLKLNPAKSERAFLWPQFLPGNKQFIFFVSTDFAETTGVYSGNTASPGSCRLLFASETNAVYSGLGESGSRQSGYLLFVRGRAPMAQAFKASSLALEGDPFSIGDPIGSLRSLSLAPLSVSGNATLVYQMVGDATRQMVWLNRSGKQTAVVRETGEWGPPRISPDGMRAAAARLASDGHADLWLLDADGTATQFTATPAHEGSPVWSPDGSRLAFFVSGKTEGNFDLYSESVRGGKAEPLYKSNAPKYPTDWSHDGRYLLFTTMPRPGRADIWAYSTTDHRAGPILDTIYMEAYASLSPDGKWLAYQSDESGSPEVYVQAFDGITAGTKRRWRVSAGVGGLPRWRADGRELFYVTYTGRMMAVAVHAPGDGLAFDTPQMLFQTRPLPKTWNFYDVSPDGQRFLMNLPLEVTHSPAITVLTNWIEKLKRVAAN